MRSINTYKLFQPSTRDAGIAKSKDLDYVEEEMDEDEDEDEQSDVDFVDDKEEEEFDEEVVKQAVLADPRHRDNRMRRLYRRLKHDSEADRFKADEELGDIPPDDLRVGTRYELVEDEEGQNFVETDNNLLTDLTNNDKFEQVGVVNGTIRMKQTRKGNSN